jgi:hypothetical protein
VDSQKHVNDTFQNLWVHNFPDQNFVGPQIFKITLVDPQKIKRLSFFQKKKIGGTLAFFLKFDKPLKFSSDFDDLSNGASIAKHNTVPMFFYVFRFPIESIF